eukprot:4125059-Amphidinium_carterae.2
MGVCLVLDSAAGATCCVAISDTCAPLEGDLLVSRFRILLAMILARKSSQAEVTGEPRGGRGPAASAENAGGRAYWIRELQDRHLNMYNCHELGMGSARNAVQKVTGGYLEELILQVVQGACYWLLMSQIDKPEEIIAALGKGSTLAFLDMNKRQQGDQSGP